MTLPTPDEIRIAYNAAKLDEATLGPSTDGMTQLVLSDPTLRRCADRMAGGRPSTDGRLSHVLAAAIAVGLNYGLRIGDQRLQDLIIEIGRERLERRTADPNRPLPEPDTPETVAEKLRGTPTRPNALKRWGGGVVVIEWNAESDQFDPGRCSCLRPSAPARSH